MTISLELLVQLSSNVDKCSSGGAIPIGVVVGGATMLV